LLGNSDLFARASIGTLLQIADLFLVHCLIAENIIGRNAFAGLLHLPFLLLAVGPYGKNSEPKLLFCDVRPKIPLL
jgi:hypothetical protein